MLNKGIIPAIIGLAACVFLYLLGINGKGIVFTSLANLSLSVTFFLVLTALFYELKKLKLNTQKIYSFFSGIKNIFPFAKKTHAKPEQELPQDIKIDGLVSIQKEKIYKEPEENNSWLRILEVIYILLFLGIAVWSFFTITACLRASFSDLNHGFMDALFLLIFPFLSSVYLKMRKDGQYPCHKISNDLLVIFAVVSVIYAVCLSFSAALKINILSVLKWVNCAAIAYIPLSFGFNIILSAFKKNILDDFNYSLFIDIKKNRETFFESQEVKQNFSLKSLYTIKYAVKILPAVLFGLGFLLFLSTSVFVVQPHQKALVFRLGKLNNTQVINEGLHFKLPWPFEMAEIYDVHRVSSMQIGYASTHTVNYLWTRSHDGGENLMLTGGGNELLAVNIKIIYKISDLYKYVTTSSNPQEILRAAAYQELMRRTVNTTLDEFLSIDRVSLSESLAQELHQFCELNQLGISVLQVIIESIHPPVNVAGIYQRVVSSLIYKSEITAKAQTEAHEKIMIAETERIALVSRAVMENMERISEAQKEVEVYGAILEMYQRNPQSLELVKYLETYERIIGNHKVYVFSPRMEGGISRAIIGNAGIIGVVNNE